MDNHAIDAFFESAGLVAAVEKSTHDPIAIWLLEAGGFPVLIQTQEDANRMRIVVFIGEAIDFEAAELRRLLEANYHSSIDARYAITDDKLVATFIHPLEELDETQFILGFYQALSCAETWGMEYSGGTMVFGAGGGSLSDGPEASLDLYRRVLVDRILVDRRT